MFRPTASVTALALLIARTMALPGAAAPAAGVDARDTYLPKLVYAEAVDGGLWTIYDDESKPLVNATASEASSIQRRCGSNNIHCDYVGFRARADLCGHLMDILGAAENRDRSMTPYTDRCFTATNIADNNRCCISWSARVTGLKVNMLVWRGWTHA